MFLKQKNSETAFERISGFKFTVYPTVFNPVEYYSSEVFAKFICSLNLSGKYILDMGCGSGVVSVFAASKGAGCLAIDINPMSVKSTLQNALQNGFADKINVLESDLFKSIAVPSHSGRASSESAEEGFDIIFFNPPYYRGIPQTAFEQGFMGGDNYEVIKRFINESKKFLAPGGTIYFIISSDMEINLLETMVRAQGFEFIIVEKIKKLFETFYITKSFVIE